MKSPLLFVGLDVGGTSMKAGVVDNSGHPLSSITVPTEAERGQAHGLSQMEVAIRQATTAAGVQLEDVTAIGVATPGTMDIAAGLILDPPNLKPWRNVAVRDHVASVFQLPTAFQNDANAAAYGEYWIGAGRDSHSMVMFTLGTGVGGGIIIGDLVIEGRHSHGGELGHMKIELYNGRLCGCGRFGCLEAYCSATAVVKRTIEALQDETAARSALHLLLREQGELSSRSVFDAALEGDLVADKIVEDTAFYLAVGVTNVLHTIDPDLVLLGGGMIAAGESFLNRIRKHVKQLAFPVPADNAVIRFAQLGADAGFIGAAACARQLHRRTQPAQPG